jgi:hypothetical protein
MAKPINFPADFWAKVDKRGPDECWPWIAKSKVRGYGIYRHFGLLRRATHVSLELAGRPRVNGAHALHKCDNRGCVNPDHLWWGDNRENTADRERKLRGNTRFAPDEVRDILTSTERVKDIARRYNACRTTITRLRRNRTYKVFRQAEGI